MSVASSSRHKLVRVYPFTASASYKTPSRSPHSSHTLQEREAKEESKASSFKETYVAETKMNPLGNNKVGSTDEYGNPIQGHGTTGYADHHHTGGYGEQGALHGHGTAGHVDHHHTGGHGAEHGTGGQQLHGGGVKPGVLRRSGSSSSSSSSEDDGMGGRRKKNKGIKDKIKEKLPGGHKDDPNPQQHYDQGVTAGVQTPETEKKGIMEKIKEKLPGSH